MFRFAAALLGLLALPALAQALPGKPLETYFQDDPAATLPREVDPTNRMAVTQLEQVLAYDPKNVSARLQHARLLIARGQSRHAILEFEAAIREAPEDSVARRQAHYAFGWALLRIGQARRAAEEWAIAARLHGGNPRWAPTTLALALWLADEKDLAIDYFAAAVRSDSRSWGSTRGLALSLRDWHEDDRATLEAVHAEWKRRLGERGG